MSRQFMKLTSVIDGPSFYKKEAITAVRVNGSGSAIKLMGYQEGEWTRVKESPSELLSELGELGWEAMRNSDDDVGEIQ